MSYLLEALRKSERERQEKSAVPGLQTPTVEWESGDENRGRSPWLMVAVLAICLNTILLVVLVWRFGFADEKTPTPAAPTAVPTTTSAATNPVTAPAMPAVIVVQQPSEPTPAIVVREREANEATRPARLPTNTIGTLPRNPSPNLQLDRDINPQNEVIRPDARRGTAQTRNDNEHYAPQPDNEARAITSLSTNEAPPSVHALPVAIRQQLPLLTMNSHIYASNVRDSFVMINGVSLSPGDEISMGLRLVAVVPEGAVLDFNGQRFLFPALASFSP